MKKSKEVKELAENFFKRNTMDGLPIEALGWLLAVLGDEAPKSPRRCVFHEISLKFSLTLPQQKCRHHRKISD
jgi:hypothetical protein